MSTDFSAHADAGAKVHSICFHARVAHARDERETPSLSNYRARSGSGRSMARTLAHGMQPRRNASESARNASALRRARAHARPCSAHIFWVSPRIETDERAHVVVLAESISGASDSAKSDAPTATERIKSKRRARSSQSNFSSSSSSHFCRQDVASADCDARNAPRIK